MQWDLIEGALLIARQQYPDLDTRKYVSMVDGMSREAVGLIGRAATKREKIAALNDLFFGTMGFRGNQEDYYDLRNSYLCDVLETKQGIPITLSALYLKLAWSAGCPLYGINFPGHFLVAWKEPGEDVSGNIYLDIFDEGKELGRPELGEMLQRSSGRPQALETLIHLRNAGVKDILHRMLGNVKSIHAAHHEMERSLWAAQWMCLLKPNDWNSLRDQGLFHFSLGRMQEAEKCLEEYLEKTGKPVDYAQVWQVLYTIRATSPTSMN
jgi:regulator of sirC expression with transglutaminase-like and TPR domain